MLKPEFALTRMTVWAMAVATSVGSPVEIGASLALDERPAEFAGMTQAQTLEGINDPGRDVVAQ